MYPQKYSMLRIYTDGSCSPNPGRGGWGVYCLTDRATLEACDGKLKTTNNEMEMMAFLQGLELIGSETDVIIFTDSKYVMNEVGERVRNGRVSGWLVGQMRNGWRSGKGEIKNVGLWRRIVHEISSRKLTFQIQWVKGHSGDFGNERADTLANLGRSKTTI